MPVTSVCELRAWGEGSSLQSLAGARPTGAGNRVTYVLPGLREWYANGPLGVEQGFTVEHAPAASTAAGGSSGLLTLAIGLSGNTHPTLEAGAHGLLLSRAGKGAVRYTGLQATDARGRSLKSWLSLEGGRLLVHVDASNALYPLQIDPFLQQGEKLTGSGESGKAEFGGSVALSSDGDTALIGASGDNSFTGAAWVFTRSAGKWTQQGEKLTGTGESGHGEFGWEVALSSEGNTALIGGVTDNVRTGAAWVFTRSGSTWSQQGEKLTGGGETGEGEFGSSVRLSAEGTTALIGGRGDNTSAGAAWVFTLSGGKWTQQGSKLTGGEEVGEGEFGASAALAGNGLTAVIGGPRDSSSVGAAWVFTESAGKWTQQGPKLTGGEETGKGRVWLECGDGLRRRDGGVRRARRQRFGRCRVGVQALRWNLEPAGRKAHRRRRERQRRVRLERGARRNCDHRLGGRPRRQRQDRGGLGVHRISRQMDPAG